MAEFLRLKRSNCKNCYKCIRNCPVKSIRFSAGQANVVENECILCGRCFAACPQNAKQVQSDVEKVKVLTMSEQVYVSLAPSFAACYPGAGIEAMEEALKKLGFAGVEETAIGATMVAREYERILKEEAPNVLISSCCTSVNLLVRKHYPEVLFALAPVLSPMEAHCRDLKNRYPGAKTVFIGPCIAKKQEASERDLVDAVLTFDELNEMLLAAGVQIEGKEDVRKAGKARLFPTTGGVLATMEKLPEYTYISVDGVERCAEVLEEIKAGALHKCFIEMSSCPGSCSGGPVLGKHHGTPAQNYARVLRYAGEDRFEVEQPAKETFAKPMEPIAQEAVMPSQAEIEAMLRKMGKKGPEDELNCGSCGYNSCREKAAAVIQGKAEQSMCLPYMMAKEEGFSEAVVNNSPNAILVLNDDLEVQRINPVACKLLHVRSEKDVLGEDVIRLMDPDVFREVRDRGKRVVDQRTYMAEYGCYVDRTILYNKEYHLFICIMKDVSDEMSQQERKLESRMQAFDIANDVARRQLKIVQDIASLLGETAADTLIALEHLKETISDD
ncbi:MAG: PAS domain-containing protein [Clostridiales bacterium]|nr:PAS domain-containing protein [Clostridiales bacterium]